MTWLVVLIVVLVAVASFLAGRWTTPWTWRDVIHVVPLSEDRLVTEEDAVEYGQLKAAARRGQKWVPECRCGRRHCADCRTVSAPRDRLSTAELLAVHTDPDDTTIIPRVLEDVT